MARPDEIRAAAKVSLERYKADPNYQYLLQHCEDFTPKTRNRLSIDAVIGYATGLERAINEDKLVDMRRHERCEHYLQSFEDCVRRMQAAPPEVVQRSFLFPSADLPDEADGDDFDESADMDANDEYDEPEAEPVSKAITQKTEKAARHDEKPVSHYADSPVQSAVISPYDNIPGELKSLNQWTVYKTYTDRENGKLKK